MDPTGNGLKQLSLCHYVSRTVTLDVQDMAAVHSRIEGHGRSSVMQTQGLNLECRDHFLRRLLYILSLVSFQKNPRVKNTPQFFRHPPPTLDF